MRGNQTDGLQMSGLSQKLQGECRAAYGTVYGAFAQRRGVKSYPHRVVVVQMEPIWDRPQNYLIKMTYGVQDADAMRMEGLTPDPVWDIRHKFDRQLEIHFAHRSLGTRKP